MKKPAAVMIDMFGVIIEEHRGNLPKYIAARSPLPDAQRFLDRAEYNKYYRPASEGAESSEDFLRRFGFGDANAAAREYVSDFVTFDRGFVAFAERCRAEGIALSLLSNDISAVSRAIREVYGIGHCFADAVISEDVRIRKPDPAIFRLAAERLKLDPADCVYVDDQPENLAAARDCGFRVIHFCRPTALPGEGYETARDFAELWTELACEISHAGEHELGVCAQVVRESFAEIAARFGLTEQNCATNGAFADECMLRGDRERGAEQFMVRHFSRPAGYVGLYPADEGGELCKLSVLPQYRHMGYGAALVRFCAELVRRRGGKKLSLCLIDENARLKNWYIKLGFKQTGTRDRSDMPFTVCYMEMEV